MLFMTLTSAKLNYFKVIPCQSVDSGFDKNKSELSILVLPVPLQMLADGHSLLDEEVDVLWQVGGEPLPLQDPKDLVASDESDLGNTVGVPQDHTNLKIWEKFELAQFLQCILKKKGVEKLCHGHESS